MYANGTPPKIIPMSKHFLQNNTVPLEQYTDLLVFDIDNTLYQSNINLIGRVISQTFDKLGINDENARARILEECKAEYGFSIKGMYAYNILDYKTYYDVITNIDYKAVVSPDPDLRHMLENVHTNKICFTNAESIHCMRILSKLELDGVFDYVLCVDHSEPNFICKPMNESFDFLEQLFGVRNKITFFDDDPRNIAMAKQRGWIAHHVTSMQTIKMLLLEICQAEDRK